MEMMVSQLRMQLNEASNDLVRSDYRPDGDIQVVYGRMRQLEAVLSVKDEEVLSLRRELQMRDLDVKNFATVEASLKQEVRQLMTGRVHLEEQI